ncbi:MAG TPA: glycosyltransferase [Verrucomicrobiae bacterium]|jgi:spore maturation protein CgeB|nr:glycosyltransferase [Verrucomicrobiae bacterium]
MSHRLNISFFGSSLVSASQNPAVTYYRGLIRALTDRGHRITFYEPKMGEGAKRDTPNPTGARVVTYPATDESVLDALEQAEESDLIVKCSGVGAFDELLEAAVLELKKPETLVAFLDSHAPATLERLRNDPEDLFHVLIREYDLIFTRCGGAPVVESYLAAGAAGCVPLPDAVDPQVHFPAQCETRFEADLALLCDRNPHKETRVEEFFFRPAAQMPERKFLIAGDGWQGKPMPANVNYPGSLRADEHNAFNSTPRAVLSLNRGCATRYGFSPTAGVFEAAGAGACLIMDKWEGIELFLEPDREVLVAGNGEELVSQLRELTPEKARQIGHAAYARVLAEHTFAHRAEQIEKVLAGKEGRVIA